MNSGFEVLWTHSAENDLKGIIEYIAESSPQNALDVLQQIRKKASDLDGFPERGRIVPELHDQGIFQYRKLIFKPWRLIYRILGNRVYVLSLIDSRQNVEDILLKKIVF